jgi:hypothetical protein
VELREMVDGLASEDQYQWETGELSNGKVPITYLIGYPRASFPNSFDNNPTTMANKKGHRV